MKTMKFNPNFSDSMTPEQFRDAAEEYSKWAVSHYDTFDEVDLDSVSIEVSQKMKRAAGKAGEKDGKLFMRFAYGAYEKWGWGNKITETIRHELVHILQYQIQGRASHGYFFKIKADEVNAPRHCTKFTEYTYGIFCSKCDEFLCGRYQRSKMVKKAKEYRSKCCNASCYSERVQ